MNQQTQLAFDHIFIESNLASRVNEQKLGHDLRQTTQLSEIKKLIESSEAALFILTDKTYRSLKSLPYVYSENEHKYLIIQQTTQSPRADKSIIGVISEEDLKSQPEILLKNLIQNYTRTHQNQAIKKSDQSVVQQLNHIFLKLASEKSPLKLLELILIEAMNLIEASQGYLYLFEEESGDIYVKRFLHAQHKKIVSINDVHIVVDEQSRLGQVALTNRELNLNEGQKRSPFKKNSFRLEKTIELNTMYPLLAYPIVNSQKEILAVIELNAEKSTQPFGTHDENLISSFMSQASICMENLQLYADIRGLFDGFVKAAITAIEARDPSTGGHSERVAKMTVALAESTSKTETGVYRSVRFKSDEMQELEYAALLHDFGKIGVREEVLVKAKKLFPYQLDLIRERVNLVKATIDMQFEQKIISEKQKNQHKDLLNKYWDNINRANEPSVLKQENYEILREVLNKNISPVPNSHMTLLTQEEFNALTVNRGSLTPSERLEVESHVRHTYQFLKMIPWTRNYKNLAEIAYAHHEKLDGSGYPRGLSSHEIPLQSKIMTIADIYDALTAADRWYKEAVPTEKALDIMSHEVNQGKLDPTLFEIFVKSKGYIIK